MSEKLNVYHKYGTTPLHARGFKIIADNKFEGNPIKTREFLLNEPEAQAKSVQIEIQGSYTFWVDHLCQ